MLSNGEHLPLYWRILKEEGKKKISKKRKGKNRGSIRPRYSKKWLKKSGSPYYG
ncbi:MAG: hypothetical protein ACMUEL_05025 [Flavobacteriales bacterium Tduv]